MGSPEQPVSTDAVGAKPQPHQEGNTAPASPTKALDLSSASRTLLDFMIHVFVGSLLFIVIYAPAFGLHMLVGLLDGFQLSYLLLVMQVAEYALVVADTALLFVFLWKTTHRAAMAL